MTHLASVNTYALSTVTPDIGIIYLMPFFCQRYVEITGLGFYNATAGATFAPEVGIYESDPTGNRTPTYLIDKVSGFNVNNTGTKVEPFINRTVNLFAGNLYWVAFSLIGSGSGDIQCVNNTPSLDFQYVDSQGQASSSIASYAIPALSGLPAAPTIFDEHFVTPILYISVA
jgi:hypothetical protein